MTNTEKKTEIMTLSEVAEYLKVAEKTILRMIQKKEIPCAKVASQWRFMRSMIDEWLISRMTILPQNEMADLMKTESSLVPLSRLVKKEHIIFDVLPGTKPEILRQLINPLAPLVGPAQLDTLLEKLLLREGMSSTSVGGGIAIPHIRRPEESPLVGPEVVIGLCPKGCDFDAFDDGPTRLFFLIITNSEVIHLKLLSLISRFSANTGTIKALSQSISADEVMKQLITAEQQI